MKKIITSLALISTLALTGCSHDSNKKSAPKKMNNPAQYHQIEFKCSAMKYREEHPYKTTIKDITKGDTLVFATYGSCAAQMTSVMSVDDKNNTFEVAGSEFKVKLKLNSNGKIVYATEIAEDTIQNKYYALGIIKAITMFQQPN
jgi:PBP1b-binding outer membrane lipoprotein LpoB